MIDPGIRELERRFAEGDWTVYPRLTRIREALRAGFSSRPPRVARAAEKLRALRPRLTPREILRAMAMAYASAHVLRRLQTVFHPIGGLA